MDESSAPGRLVSFDGPNPPMRQFNTGATRSVDEGRIDPEGFLSPIVIERFCAYMNTHRVQADGTVRASDNWQKGMPRETYMKGMWRHFLHLWTRHRGYVVTDPKAAENLEEDLCAIMFNAMGYLYEQLQDLPVSRDQTNDRSGRRVRL